MAKKTRKGTAKQKQGPAEKQKAYRSAQGKQRHDRRDGWKTERRQPASMEGDCGPEPDPDPQPEPEPESEVEPEPELEPVTQPTPRRRSARLAALASAGPTGPPSPLDSDDPVMLRQLKDFCELFANPNFKTVYN
ncbi:hypothetical protein QJQ45_003467 [Haematococcus lacustris]|nr:hypothetical protein QJQ45_003467 [Haematococcus lacustris]